MKKTAYMVLLLALAGAPAFADEFAASASVGVDVVNAYVDKGATFNDGLVVQPWLTLSGLPVEFSVWANYDVQDYCGNMKRNEISEVDLGVSYPFAIGPIEAAIGYEFWTYPNAEGKNDQVLVMDISGELIESLTIGVYGEYMTAGEENKSWYAMPYAEYSMAFTDDLSADLFGRIGYMNNRGDDELDNGWMHYDLGTKLNYKIVNISATYIGRIDDKVLPTGVFGYDKKWLFSAGVSYDF